PHVPIYDPPLHRQMPSVGRRHAVGCGASRVLPQDTNIALQVHDQENRPLLIAAVDKQPLPICGPNRARQEIPSCYCDLLGLSIVQRKNLNSTVPALEDGDPSAIGRKIPLIVRSRLGFQFSEFRPLAFRTIEVCEDELFAIRTPFSDGAQSCWILRASRPSLEVGCQYKLGRSPRYRDSHKLCWHWGSTLRIGPIENPRAVRAYTGV